MILFIIALCHMYIWRRRKVIACAFKNVWLKKEELLNVKRKRNIVTIN